VQWQYVVQSVVCVLGAARRVTHFELNKMHGKTTIKICFYLFGQSLEIIAELKNVVHRAVVFTVEARPFTAASHEVNCFLVK
jgi:hypothetical protein